MTYDREKKAQQLLEFQKALEEGDFTKAEKILLNERPRRNTLFPTLNDYIKKVEA